MNVEQIAVNLAIQDFSSYFSDLRLSLLRILSALLN